MNDAMILCLTVPVVGFAALLLSHSQFLQRLAVMGLLLTAAVEVSGAAGVIFAQQQMTKQYFELFSVYYENMYSYAGLLEESQERPNVRQEKERLEQWLQESLPVTERGEEQIQYLAAQVLEADNEGGYREWFTIGEAENLQDTAAKLAVRSVKSGGPEWSELSDSIGCLVLSDRDRIAPRYAVAVYIPLWPLQEKIRELTEKYLVYGAAFLAAGSLLSGALLFIQEREIRKVISLTAAVAEGREDWDRIRQESARRWIRSNEMRFLYHSLRQIADDVARMNYRKYKILQAYYRFAPKEVERILGKQSIMDVRISDSIDTSGILAAVSFPGDEKLTEKEYLRQINNNYVLLGSAKEAYGGIILSAENDLSMLQILFREEAEKAVAFGMELTGEGNGIHKEQRPFVLLHKTPFVYGVAGEEQQAFTYIHSREMKALEQYADEFRSMGIRMAVTDSIYESVGHQTQTRYIGFVEEEGLIFRIYEVLDCYPMKERMSRMESKTKFQEAMELFYQGDFYLSRNKFAEILKDCPSDGAAKRYLFLCENCLSGKKEEKVSCALFSDRKK